MAIHTPKHTCKLLMAMHFFAVALLINKQNDGCNNLSLIYQEINMSINSHSRLRSNRECLSAGCLIDN
jgi:hypothetical protein